jgi:hypothetical protein
MSEGEVEDDLLSVKGSPKSDTFHSQPDSPPLHFFPEEEDNMAAPAPAANAAPPRPPTPVRPGLAIPTFQTAGADPTREELVDYREEVTQFFAGVDFTLQFLGVVAPAWPDIQVAREVTTIAQIWQRVAELGQAVTRVHQTMVTAQQEIMEGEVTNLRMARGATAGTGTGGNRRAKGVVPTKFGGKGEIHAEHSLLAARIIEPWNLEPSMMTSSSYAGHYNYAKIRQDHGQSGKWNN